MLNRMIKTGIASVALAASAVLIATPASATPLAAPVSLKGFAHINQWGQTQHDVARLKRQALYECECQLQYDAQAYGYRYSKVANYDIQQIGPYKFKIYTKAKLFDGYATQYDTYDCLVRNGRVLNSSHLTPIVHKRSRRGFNRRNGFRNSGFSFRFGY